MKSLGVTNLVDPAPAPVPKGKVSCSPVSPGCGVVPTSDVGGSKEVEGAASGSRGTVGISNCTPLASLGSVPLGNRPVRSRRSRLSRLRSCACKSGSAGGVV